LGVSPVVDNLEIMNKTALSVIAALTVAASVSAIVVSRRRTKREVQVDETEQAEVKRREINAARKAEAEKATSERKAAEARAAATGRETTATIPVDREVGHRTTGTAKSKKASQQEAAHKTLQAMAVQERVLDAADSVAKRENEATNASVEQIGKSKKRESFKIKSILVDTGRGTPNTSFSDYDSAMEEHEEFQA
jgi:mannitol-specific phosphotransferase system IIBC component